MSRGVDFQSGGRKRKSPRLISVLLGRDNSIHEGLASTGGFGEYRPSFRTPHRSQRVSSRHGSIIMRMNINVSLVSLGPKSQTYLKRSPLPARRSRVVSPLNPSSWALHVLLAHVEQHRRGQLLVLVAEKVRLQHGLAPSAPSRIRGFRTSRLPACQSQAPRATHAGQQSANRQEP